MSEPAEQITDQSASEPAPAADKPDGGEKKTTCSPAKLASIKKAQAKRAENLRSMGERRRLEEEEEKSRREEEELEKKALKLAEKLMAKRLAETETSKDADPEPPQETSPEPKKRKKPNTRPTGKSAPSPRPTQYRDNTYALPAGPRYSGIFG